METIAGRYELLEVLGRGGMGVVYRAQDELLQRQVAVKVLPGEFADDALLVERFEREARAAARLNHPNIVAVFDTGSDGTVRYIVMECVPGESLARLLGARGALPVAEAVNIAAQVADALGAAHAAGIVHRDIKPGNVMVEPSGTCKVLDFGIARAAADATLTQTASLLGSAPYMAPETTLGGAADARSDIYSLGCVLYEMLTDRPPFRGEVAAAIINQHVNSAPESPSTFSPAVPAALDALVLRMLAKDPADRPQTGADTAAALRAALSEPPTAATVAIPPTVRSAEPVPVVPPPMPPPEPTPSQAPDMDTRPPSRAAFPLTAVILAIGAALAVGVVIALAASSGSTTASSTTSGAHSSRTSTSHSSTSTPASSSTSTSSSSSRPPTTTTTTTTTTSTPTSSHTSSSSSTSSSRASSSTP